MKLSEILDLLSIHSRNKQGKMTALQLLEHDFTISRLELFVEEHHFEKSVAQESNAVLTSNEEQWLIQFLENRWKAICGTNSAYTQDSMHTANMICVDLAKELANTLHLNYLDLLMPTIVTVVNPFLDLNYTNKSNLYEFVMTEDNQGLIHVASALAEFADKEQMTKNGDICLSTFEVEAVSKHTENCKKYYNMLNNKSVIKKHENTLGAALNQLKIALELSSINGDGQEYKAGKDIDSVLVDFSKIYEGLSAKLKKKLDEAYFIEKNKIITFEYIWNALTDKDVSISNAARCALTLSSQLDELLKANFDLYTIPINSKNKVTLNDKTLKLKYEKIEKEYQDEVLNYQYATNQQIISPIYDKSCESKYLLSILSDSLGVSLFCKKKPNINHIVNLDSDKETCIRYILNNEKGEAYLNGALTSIKSKENREQFKKLIQDIRSNNLQRNSKNNREYIIIDEEESSSSSEMDVELVKIKIEKTNTPKVEKNPLTSSPTKKQLSPKSLKQLKWQKACKQIDQEETSKEVIKKQIRTNDELSDRPMKMQKRALELDGALMHVEQNNFEIEITPINEATQTIEQHDVVSIQNHKIAHQAACHDVQAYACYIQKLHAEFDTILHSSPDDLAIETELFQHLYEVQITLYQFDELSINKKLFHSVKAIKDQTVNKIDTLDFDNKMQAYYLIAISYMILSECSKNKNEYNYCIHKTISNLALALAMIKASYSLIDTKPFHDLLKSAADKPCVSSDDYNKQLALNEYKKSLPSTIIVLFDAVIKGSSISYEHLKLAFNNDTQTMFKFSNYLNLHTDMALQNTRVNALHDVANFMEFGKIQGSIGIDKNEHCKRLYRLAAEQNFSYAQYKLGCIAEANFDYKKATSYFEQAAKSNHKQAQSHLISITCRDLHFDKAKSLVNEWHSFLFLDQDEIDLYQGKINRLKKLAIMPYLNKVDNNKRIIYFDFDNTLMKSEGESNTFHELYPGDNAWKNKHLAADFYTGSGYEWFGIFNELKRLGFSIGICTARDKLTTCVLYDQFMRDFGHYIDNDLIVFTSGNPKHPELIASCETNQCQPRQMILVDDQRGHCEEANACGMKAIHVPYLVSKPESFQAFKNHLFVMAKAIYDLYNDNRTVSTNEYGLFYSKKTINENASPCIGLNNV